MTDEQRTTLQKLGHDYAEAGIVWGEADAHKEHDDEEDEDHGQWAAQAKLDYDMARHVFEAFVASL